ncbi:IS200/IS605 family transposase [Micromonospora sp. NPDC000207]|uniref:IS200/IS605 family transposase n=1 Tax=Micromonospora sp. NPDC000207 TaxID=3154246 RepID=UPI00332B034A
MHLLVNFPPTVVVAARLVDSLKGVTSRRLRQEFPDLAAHYWRAQRLWSGSYFAGSVGGTPLSVTRQYIGSQQRSASRRDQEHDFISAVNNGALPCVPVAPDRRQRLPLVASRHRHGQRSGA